MLTPSGGGSEVYGSTPILAWGHVLPIGVMVVVMKLMPYHS